MPLSKISSAGFQDNVKFRNICINGDMSIAQRGTSFTGISSGANYGLDRFSLTVSTAGTWTQSQSTDVPTGQGFTQSAKLDCTTANASLSSASALYFRQSFEGQNLQYLKKGTSSAESITASFWVKSNKTGTYICELYDGDNVRQISKSYTIDTADTWEKKTITFAGDTTGAFDNDNGNSLRLSWWLGAGSDYSSGTLNTSWNTSTSANRVVGQVNLADNTSNEWLITGVQLESGTVASSFETLPTDINLMRCQRYYEKSNNLSLFPGDTNADGYYLSNMTRATSNQNYFTVFYKVRKRVEATVTIYSYNTGASGKYRDGTNAVDYDASVGRSGEINFVMRPTSSTGVSLGDVMGFQWEANSEL